MRIMASVRSVLMVSLSVPKAIGMGPIIMRNPPLVFRCPWVLPRKSSTVAKSVSAKPERINVSPRMVRGVWLSISFSTFAVEVFSSQIRF